MANILQQIFIVTCKIMDKKWGLRMAAAIQMAEMKNKRMALPS